MEIQQSPLYARYVEALGWKVLTIDKVQIFIKHFLFLGTLAKIQRPAKLPSIKKLVLLLSRHHVSKVALEPDPQITQAELNRYSAYLKKHFRLNSSPFLPTKTIHINLAPPSEEIFNQFSEAKRRAVRRALKNNLKIYKSTNIKDLITIKNKSSGFLGFITTTGIDKLWSIFAPDHAAILLARHADRVVGGVLLLFWDKVAYYWIAAATPRGKKLFAPTILIWEAIKLAKNKGCTVFDLVGVYDQRRPRENRAWLGFTNFKEGFGGTTVYYPYS